jgi:hypothetical protein
MRNLIKLATHILLTLLRLCKPGGVKALMAENIALRQQLITLSQKRNRASQLTTQDRWLFGLVAGLITYARLHKIAIVLKPATLLRFHKVLVERKYKLLYSNKGKKKPGRKGPTQVLVDLVIEIKHRNPRYGYSIIRGQSQHPKYLSSDNDPLFKFHRWQANLQILEIDEIKSISYAPISHPFIERTIGSIRQELLDHTLFWNDVDLRKKLNKYKNCYNDTRGHSSLGQLTPNQRSEHPNPTSDVKNLSVYRWQSHCSGLFHTAIAA